MSKRNGAVHLYRCDPSTCRSAQAEHSQLWLYIGPSAATLAHQSANTATICVFGRRDMLVAFHAVNTKHLYNIYAMLDQRRRRLPVVV